ncbi:tetratricopeptide repeat protein [Antricoccus suffuscus]|uniref:tetratricopeptide repeat protein n=1 Tax=Antricoccus suffuscus TaxID=1629062 RepID=UPI000D072190|nr:tetratricopeptide repeat protein [Antricoccus suffuscus]
MLDRTVLSELNTLGEKADTVALHLVAAGVLVDSEPEKALLHARVAREMAPRLASVREASGIVAYQAGEWAEAVRDLRAARRMSGDDSHVPVLADCERALGRPERAITLVTETDLSRLPKDVRAEAAIVHSGARRDLGEIDGALHVLESFGLDPDKSPGSGPRIWYAYADTLVDAGRTDDAKKWFAQVVEHDLDEETDAQERLEALT